MKWTAPRVVFLSVVFCLIAIIITRTRDKYERSAEQKAELLLAQHLPDPVLHRMSNALEAVILPTTPCRTERLKLSQTERLRLLEQLGIVPSDADWSDYSLAEKTSWWGKRIDPGVFWSNKVVWLNGMAIGEAWRHGRSWPPMPYDDTSVADRSDNDKMGDGFDIQGGPNFHTISSERERAFWDKFGKTHPHPPEDIILWQQERASIWLRQKSILDRDPTYTARLGLKPAELVAILELNLREAQTFGYPKECLSPEAFQWAHAIQKRAEYENLIASGNANDGILMANFFRRVYVDTKLITEPLSAMNDNNANAWKTPYLRRLRAEKADEMYIQAYLKAWNLDPKAVFGP